PVAVGDVHVAAGDVPRPDGTVDHRHLEALLMELALLVPTLILGLLLWQEKREDADGVFREGTDFTTWTGTPNGPASTLSALIRFNNWSTGIWHPTLQMPPGL